MNLFIKKLIDKLFLGGITLGLLFIASNVWSIIISINTNILITAGVVILSVIIASNLSDDKSDKWFRNN